MSKQGSPGYLCRRLQKLQIESSQLAHQRLFILIHTVVMTITKDYKFIT